MKNILLNNWFNESSYFSQKIINGDELDKEGFEKALSLFKQAAISVPAYKRFLNKNKINYTQIRTKSDFQKIPPITKENYIHENFIDDLCWGGAIHNMQIVATSSGTTGKPLFWPRTVNHDIDGAYIHQYIFESIFKVSKKRTLFLNGFALGNWIAGIYTLNCVQFLIWKGLPMTLMNPGYSIEEVMSIFTADLIQKYDQIIISGHIPFLKDIIESLDNKFDITRLPKIKLLGAGQGFTEDWRDYVLNKLKTRDKTSIINLYGSADAALMGFETRESIYLRRYFHNNQQKAIIFFSDVRLPSIYNYDPRFIYFQNFNKELLVTKDYGIPLIRYNIHDEGGTFSKASVKMQNKKAGLKGLKNDHEFPFVFLFGRDKFMVKFYGANIYFDNICSLLDVIKIEKKLTGRFHLEILTDELEESLLVCRLELASKGTIEKKLIDSIQLHLLNELVKINSEYKFIVSRLGERAHIKVFLYERGHKKYFPINKIIKSA